MLVGCVTKSTHVATLTELEQAQKALTKLEADKTKLSKVLFNSGQAQVKPAGLKILTQVSDVLKNVTDKQIRIERHTDNVPIGVKTRDKFPTNWELSTARATNVVRFFIQQGGVSREFLEVVGFADTGPVASNDTEDGRTENRRIEIVLYPKELSFVAEEVKP